MGRLLILLILSTSLTSCFHFRPPRCRVQGCQVKMIHAHAGKEYRGRPWWKFNQNPKVGQKFNGKNRDKIRGDL